MILISLTSTKLCLFVNIVSFLSLDVDLMEKYDIQMKYRVLLNEPGCLYCISTLAKFIMTKFIKSLILQLI